MLSLGNVFLGSFRIRGQSHIILQCMIKTTVPHTLQVCWIPREPRRADIGLFYRLQNIQMPPHKYSINGRKLHVLYQQAYN